ncbi:hypothetical protein SKAU_G00213250 [Synaphobranchus kaupii]|uniref:Uncharacterized protein n=1 Tax=Synaphobranchus kaupii TaxID=118154 RepID=A0A9Q1F9R3_SYNKA|nr:hypothetical protein SKAU_G00213250 [Synaphobranchus kaupii]
MGQVCKTQADSVADSRVGWSLRGEYFTDTPLLFQIGEEFFMLEKSGASRISPVPRFPALSKRGDIPAASPGSAGSWRFPPGRGHSLPASTLASTRRDPRMHCSQPPQCAQRRTK